MDRVHESERRLYARRRPAGMRIITGDDDECRTARLLLRPLRVEDTGALFALFNNWNVVRFLSSPPWPYSRKDAETFVRGAVEHAPGFDEDVRAIALDGALIGLIGVRLRPANALQRGPGPNIGYWLGQAFWGRGFMTEATAAFVGMLFDRLETDVLYCGAFAENAASLTIQQKIGFVQDGEAPLFSRPRGATFRHVNTVLRRERFDAARNGSEPRHSDPGETS